MILPCLCQIIICANYIPHVPISSCAHVHWQLCQYMCLIWTECNQQCGVEHWCTNISHYWHMPLKKYASHITHVPLHFCYVYIWTPHHWTYKPKKCNFELQHYCHICANKTLAPQMSCMKINWYADITKLYQYVHLIWTHLKQQCDHKHCYTYIYIASIWLWTNMSLTMNM